MFNVWAQVAVWRLSATHSSGCVTTENSPSVHSFNIWLTWGIVFVFALHQRANWIDIYVCSPLSEDGCSLFSWERNEMEKRDGENDRTTHTHSVYRFGFRETIHLDLAWVRYSHSQRQFTFVGFFLSFNQWKQPFRSREADVLLSGHYCVVSGFVFFSIFCRQLR